MKKKVFVLFSVLSIMFLMIGCTKDNKDVVCDNLSEKTEIYYWGENENVYASLSVGSREKDYLLDGISNEKTKFSLLTIKFKDATTFKSLNVNIVVDDKSYEKVVELNDLNNSFMIDLEMPFNGNENISIIVDGKTIEMKNVSSEFKIGCNEVIDIAIRELKDKIFEKRSYNKLNSECYLRILDKNANNFEQMFWCFTVLNIDNESYSIIISTEDGSILAKSN